jgi:hypothetical protein
MNLCLHCACECVCEWEAANIFLRLVNFDIFGSALKTQNYKEKKDRNEFFFIMRSLVGDFLRFYAEMSVFLFSTVFSMENSKISIKISTL